MDNPDNTGSIGHTRHRMKTNKTQYYNTTQEKQKQTKKMITLISGVTLNQNNDF
jgi:hypothetical protein